MDLDPELLPAFALTLDEFALWLHLRYRVEGRRAARSRQRFPPGRRHWWDDLVTLFAVAPSPSATAGR